MSDQETVETVINRLYGARSRFGMPGWPVPPLDTLDAQGREHIQFIFDVLGEAIEAIRVREFLLWHATVESGGLRVRYRDLQLLGAENDQRTLTLTRDKSSGDLIVEAN